MNGVPFTGEELRARREALGLSLEDVFGEVRVPVAYMRALEDGDLAALPSSCYAAGFLDTYCRFLGLPAARHVDRLSAALHQDTGPGGEAARATAPGRPAWQEDLLTWAAISAVLLLGWLTYATVVRPEAEVTDKRVEAGTVEMVVPPTAF